MAWSTPSSRSTNEFVTAAIWNQDVVDNMLAVRTGELATTGQAAGHLIVTTSASAVSSTSDEIAKLFVEVFL